MIAFPPLRRLKVIFGDLPIEKEKKNIVIFDQNIFFYRLIFLLQKQVWILCFFVY